MVLPVPGDKRSVFLVPDKAGSDGSFEVAYIGTTDTDHEGSLDDPECSSEDVEYLLRAVNSAMQTTVTPDNVIGVWSGLRPLVTSDEADEGRTADVSRRHRVDSSRSGYVRVVGGKLTTYRSMAEDTVNHVEQVLGKRRPCSTRKTMLADRNEHMLNNICAEGASQSELIPGAQLSEADVVYAVRYEAAIHLVDVMTRRSRLHLLHRDLAERCADSVSRIMQRELGWSDAYRDDEVTAYARVCRAEISAMSKGSV
jgi:glycerol-3-phosphate dehydrogenase